ncbi:MAG: amidohydrolase family protein [Aureliella sp.]
MLHEKTDYSNSNFLVNYYMNSQTHMNNKMYTTLRLLIGIAVGVCTHIVLPNTALSQGIGTQPDVGIRSNVPSDVLLRGASVIVDASSEPMVSDVLIVDGRIVQVGIDIGAPAGIDEIDLEGKYVYPALIDPFVEFEQTGFEPKAGHWADGVTPELKMSAVGDFTESKLQQLRKAGFAIVLAAPSTGMIKGQSCVIATGDAPLEQNMLRATAMQHMRLYPSRRSRENYPNSPMGAVALLRQTLSDTNWYVDAQRAVAADPSLEAPEFNSSLVALSATVNGSQSAIIDGPNELYAVRADRLAREFSLRAIIRGSGREYRRLDQIADTNRTFLIPVDFPDAPEVTSAEEIANTTLQDLMHWKLAPTNPRLVAESGLIFALTSDGLDSTGEFLANVRKAVDAGLSPDAALKAMTETPAKILGVEHLAGSITRGKLANLIVTNEPIFDDDAKVEETWVIGKRYRTAPSVNVDLRGEWDLVVGSESLEIDLEISGKLEKLKGTLETEADEVADADDVPKPNSAEEVANSEDHADDASEDADEEDERSTELKSLNFNGYQLTGSFNAADIVSKRSGVATLSAALFGADDDYELAGSILWADGTSSQFAGRLEQDDDSDSDDLSASAHGDDSSESDEQSSDATDGVSEQLVVDVNYPLGAYGAAQQPQQAEWVLVKGATIWTSGPEGILENADLLVHNGVIDSVGVDLKAPNGATVIDAEGMHVSPGIIDCHSHMATDGGVNESGQAVTAEVRIGDFIDPGDINIYRQLAGGVTTSNILHGSANPIGGQNQVIKLRWGGTDEELKMTEAPQGIKFALGENVKRSSSDDSTRYPRTRMGVEQIMRDRFEAAKLYKAEHAEWKTTPSGLPPRRDYELEAIAEILDGTRWIHCHSYRQDEILAMLRTLDDYEVTIGSLQHILEGYKVADAMAEHGAMGSSFSDWWAYKFEVYDAIAYNGALMHEAGVVVSFNSDDRELARHLNHEAAKAVKYGGVSNEEALKFVTLNPAKQLRIEKWVGSLEPGKHADFVIWNRSPLSTLSMCMQTWVDGRKYFDREEDLKRRKLDRQLHRDLVQSILDTGAKMGPSKSDEDPSTWWARHDEFCHHAHDDDDHISHQHHDEHE